MSGAGRSRLCPFGWVKFQRLPRSFGGFLPCASRTSGMCIFCHWGKGLSDSRQVDLCTVENHTGSLDPHALFNDGVRVIDFRSWVCRGTWHVVLAVGQTAVPE